MNANWLPIASFIISLLAIPTLMGLIWKDIWERKKENSEKRKEEKKKELQENVREVMQEELKPLNESVEVLDKKIDLVSDGTVSSLRNNIKDCFYRCNDKGYRNDYDFKNIHSLYKSYQNLHGNSFIDDIMKRFDSLPPKEDFLKKKADDDNKNTRLKGKKIEGGASDGE